MSYFSDEAEEVTVKLLDRLRLEMENCDSMQAITISHSISGGTGSGLSTLLFVFLFYSFCILFFK